MKYIKNFFVMMALFSFVASSAMDNSQADGNNDKRNQEREGCCVTAVYMCCMVTIAGSVWPGVMGKYYDGVKVSKHQADKPVRPDLGKKIN